MRLLPQRAALGALALLAIVRPGAATAQEPSLLSPLFSDHAVLQQESDASLWGTARPDATVEVRADWDAGAVLARTTAGADGRWLAAVSTPAAGGPWQVTVRASAKGVEAVEQTIRDVWTGEIWLCSGQSNMEWKLGRIVKGERGAENAAALAAADLPRIRWFDVPNRMAPFPQRDLTGSWRVCTPDSAGGMSAVAFYFARRLHADLEIPIGIVTSDWGGTPAQAWTSREGLADFPRFAQDLNLLDAMTERPDEIATREQEAEAHWVRDLGNKDPGTGGGWMQPDLDLADWGTVQVPGTLEGEWAGFDGIVWLRREVVLPAEAADKDLALELGPIDDMDVTYWNGRKVGQTVADGSHTRNRRYIVPADLVRSGSNTLAVRIHDTGGAAGLTAAAAAIRAVPAAGSPLPLAGEWSIRRGADQSALPDRPRSTRLSPGMAAVLYNGMIAPLAPLSFRGATWYQGESNRSRPDEYARLLPAMIRDWRRTFSEPALPFHIVQIAPFGYRDEDPNLIARLREAQARTAMTVPHTGLAVTVDVGNPEDIHPWAKAPVGDRLARLALRRQYGRQDVVDSGPTLSRAVVEDGGIRLFFDHTDGGLPAKDGLLEGFRIAGDDRRFVDAQAVVETADGGQATVLVTSAEVRRPVSVRYAWGSGVTGGLRNGAGLPAAPFRTDDW